MTLNQASLWKVGTCRPDVKGETQVGGPQESESSDAGHRDRPTRLVKKSRNGDGAKGLDHPALPLVNQRWEEPNREASFA